MNNQSRPSRSSQRPGKKKTGRGSIVKRVLLWILGLLILMVVAGACVFFLLRIQRAQDQSQSIGQPDHYHDL